MCQNEMLLSNKRSSPFATSGPGLDQRLQFRLEEDVLACRLLLFLANQFDDLGFMLEELVASLGPWGCVIAFVVMYCVQRKRMDVHVVHISDLSFLWPLSVQWLSSLFLGIVLLPPPPAACGMQNQ